VDRRRRVVVDLEQDHRVAVIVIVIEQLEPGAGNARASGICAARMISDPSANT
jgi:hypothetical protein